MMPTQNCLAADPISQLDSPDRYTAFISNIIIIHLLLDYTLVPVLGPNSRNDTVEPKHVPALVVLFRCCSTGGPFKPLEQT